MSAEENKILAEFCEKNALRMGAWMRVLALREAMAGNAYAMSGQARELAETIGANR